MKYRKKPLAVNAYQFRGEHPLHTNPAPKWLKDALVQDKVQYATGAPDEEPFLQIHTLEGVMVARIGDWVIKGVQGELYLCKPDIFEATYEGAEGEPPKATGEVKNLPPRRGPFYDEKGIFYGVPTTEPPRPIEENDFVPSTTYHTTQDGDLLLIHWVREYVPGSKSRETDKIVELRKELQALREEHHDVMETVYEVVQGLAILKTRCNDYFQILV